MSQMLSHLEKR
jgi:hypothetical protein